MDFEKLIGQIVEVLEKLDIPYAITGGYAVSIWGSPRSTFDIDVVIKLFRPKVPSLAKALRSISDISYIDENMMERAIEREGEFNFIHADSGIKIDFWVAGRSKTSQLELERRRLKTIKNKKIYFISPEDLILVKLKWPKDSGSEKQLGDIVSILKIQKKLDLRYIRKWAKIQSTAKIFESLYGRVK